MKAIVINATVRPTDDAVTLEDLKKCLGHLGTVEFGVCSEIEYTRIGKGKHRAVWLYPPCDETEPYYKVALPGEITGEPVPSKEAARLQREGVCVEFRAAYPRADKYGVPAYGASDVAAAGVVADHGFRVAEDGFDVSVEDRGDDGGEEMWFKILVPENPGKRRLQSRKRR